MKFFAHQHSVAAARTPVGSTQRRASSRSGFTIVEIALCLGIIGFALLAIINILPTGLSVQQDNREETIIDQDAAVWMGAIRSGAMGYNDLGNYVIGITNYWTLFDAATNPTTTGSDNYCGDPSKTSYPITNSLRVIGLLSTPTILSPPPFGRQGLFQSNYMVAYIRAMSGAATEKYPQTDPSVLDMAFAYKMIVENDSYVGAPPLPTNAIAEQFVRRNLMVNSHSLRLFFRYPLYANGTTGNGRQTFRAFTGGVIITNIVDPIAPKVFRFYFFQPSYYVRTP